MFELIDRDAAGRITCWEVAGRKLTLPNIAIVINPGKLPVSMDELKKKFRAEIIITNSYIISKSGMRKEIEEKGLHKYLGWDGPIYTDSGTYQMYSQGIGDIDSRKIVGYQLALGSDIITPVDLFTTPKDSRSRASRNLKETLERIKDAREAVKGSLLVGPLQGGRFLELRRQACKAVPKLSPDVFAIGGIVPYMEAYRFSELADVILTCKTALPAGRPVHAFGAGHPMVFAFLAALGCDLFDSAMYSLAAERNAYLTVSGTYPLEELREFPCSCPICSKFDPQELRLIDKAEREKHLAAHNLYVTFEELRRVRQAIRSQSLWELVQERARAHPSLLEALQSALRKHSKYFLSKDLVSKKSAFFYSGPESEFRPEVLRARQWMKRVLGGKFIRKPFGSVPLALKGLYPFGQSIIPGQELPRKNAKPPAILKATLQYQYGKAAPARFSKARLEISKKTGRIRRVWEGEIGKGSLLGTVRPSDGFFLPSKEGARLLGAGIKKVMLPDSEAAAFVRQGKSAFAKFCRPLAEILPGEEVALVSKNKEILAVGRAKLSSKEMKEMERGIAVEIRAI